MYYSLIVIFGSFLGYLYQGNIFMCLYVEVVAFVHNSPVNLSSLLCVCVGVLICACVCIDAEVLLQSCCYYAII